jgi:hypothetical protein
MGPLWRPRRTGIERRKLPRIPLAVPVRYATDQGQVGIGVLIDVHAKGAGLLAPTIAVDAFHVWIQFMWFNDRMGIQGRVVFVRETPDGFHVGLELHPLPAETKQFLTTLLIPYGLRKFQHDRKHLPSFLASFFGRRSDSTIRQRRRRYLPVLIEQGSSRTWAVTEDRNDLGIVLLLAHPLEKDISIRLTTWGSVESQDGTITRVEKLELPQATLYRIGVLFEHALLAADPVVTDPSMAASQDRS